MAKKVGARSWGSIRELPSGNFQIRYPDPLGVYRNGRVTFTKKRLAEQELENIRIAIQKRLGQLITKLTKAFLNSKL